MLVSIIQCTWIWRVIVQKRWKVEIYSFKNKVSTFLHRARVKKKVSRKKKEREIEQTAFWFNKREQKSRGKSFFFSGCALTDVTTLRKAICFFFLFSGCCFAAFFSLCNSPDHLFTKFQAMYFCSFLQYFPLKKKSFYFPFV